nr:hypothetical protein OG781_18215 [Streptomyces sp. NBC_00830]
MAQILASSLDTWWYGVAAIGQAVVALAVAFGVFGLRQSRKLRIIAYEDRFEERYWSLMERLSLQALKGAVQPDARVCTDDDRLAVRSYFRLCETQLNVRAAGWITDATWKVWGQGITDRMHRFPFDEGWDEIVANPRADRLYRRLRQFVDGGSDPCPLPRRKRWWRGLTGSNCR